MIPVLSALGATAIAAPRSGGTDLDFLLQKAAEAYCGFMEEQNPKTMTTFERGLYEGMALGFVMGQYPEQSGVLADLEDKTFENGFYGQIRDLCPSKSFL